MPSYANFVPQTQRTIICTSDCWVGWRLDPGVYVRGVDVYISNLVATAQFVNIRAAIGASEPTAESGMDQLPIQLTAYAPGTTSFYLLGSLNLRLWIGQRARHQDRLAIQLNSAAGAVAGCLSLDVDTKPLKVKK